MNLNTAQAPSLGDHQKAFTEVAFLLDIFASTIDNIMGGATSSVGRFAGRGTASKWPVDLHHPSLHKTLDVVVERMKDGFEITYSEQQDGIDVTFKRCVIRDVCSKRGLEPGCSMCKLFHSYCDGIVNELFSRPVKSEIVQSGDTCTLRMKVQ